MHAPTSTLGSTGRARIGFLESENDSLEIISLGHVMTDEMRASTDRWWNSMQALERLSNARKDEEEVVEITGPGKELAGSYLIVDCGPHRLAITASLIQEVIADDIDHPLHDAKRNVIGLIDLRGHSLPVIDLRLRLDLASGADADGRPCIVVIHDGDGWTGVRVDRVVEWARLEAASFVDDVKTAVEAHPHFFRGVSLHDSHEIHVIELPALLADDQDSYKNMIRELGMDEVLKKTGESTT